MKRMARVGAIPLKPTKMAAAAKDTTEERQGRKREKNQLEGTSKMRLLNMTEALSQPCSVRERSSSSDICGSRKPIVSMAMTTME